MFTSRGRYRRPVSGSSRRLRRWFRRGEPGVTGPHTAELSAAFSTIYEDETWTDKLPGMPRSGRGALYERSLSVVQFIEDRIAAGDVRSIVDVGCGDLTYMSHIDAVVNGNVSYVGYDIVPALVDEHRRLSWGDFRVGDITAPGFRVDADLVIVKDVLFHLEDAQIDAALRNLASSTWRCLLLTSTDNESNAGRAFDRWHFAPVNFCAPPYSFPPEQVLERIDGGGFLVLRPDGLRWPR
jgi:SAM-dependent methyltransferase